MITNFQPLFKYESNEKESLPHEFFNTLYSLLNPEDQALPAIKSHSFLGIIKNFTDRVGYGIPGFDICCSFYDDDDESNVKLEHDVLFGFFPEYEDREPKSFVLINNFEFVALINEVLYQIRYH